MNRVIQHLSLSLLLGFGACAWAQFDSSALLLRSSGQPVSTQDLDSSRYKIRAPESHKDQDELAEKPGTYIPSPVPPTTEQEKPQIAGPPPNPNPTATPQSNAPAATTAPPSVPVQVKQLILGDQDAIENARKQINPNDPRANVVEVSLAPAYFYDGSSSDYSYRRYNTNGPGMGLGMNVWFTPFFGLQSDYFASFSSAVRSGDNMVPADLQDFNVGLRFRKNFGYSLQSAQISWGLDYHDSSTKISKDSTSTIGRRSTGLGLSLEGTVPESARYAHTFRIDFQPRLHQSEQDTGVDVTSGQKCQTDAVSLSLGGIWTLDRHNQVFWRGQYSVERNLFQGDASKADPQTGTTPSGVSVTDSLLIFYFGFQWGS